MNLNELKQQMQETCYPGSRTLPAGTCIQCKQWAFSEEKGYNPNRFHTDAGMREFHISKLCEICFDSLFADDEE